MEERGWQGPDSILGGGRLSYFLVETLSITGQKHLKCLKNGNGRLRKGKSVRPSGYSRLWVLHARQARPVHVGN